MAISNTTLRISLSISLEVAQITNMALGVTGGTMRLAEGVEVRAGGGAAVGVVAKLVHVHAPLGVGVVARDVIGDGRGRGLGGLLEGYGSADFGVAAENGN